MPRQMGIYVYDQVEILDFAGPFEVFATASRVYGRLHPHRPEPFFVFTVGEEKCPIRARGGLTILPEYPIASAPPIDLLLIPGGIVTQEMAKPQVIDWIRTTARQAELTASVCTGVFLLAQAGLLDGIPVTTHWEDLEELKRLFPQLIVCGGSRWIETGSISTSAGISAGLDMSLHLVKRLIGSDLAEQTARQMDYAWRQHPSA